MILRSVAALLCTLVIAGAVPARAETSERDVSSMLEKVKQGKPFREKGAIPGQVFVFEVAPYLHYSIDVGAQLCFLHTSGGVAAVPCAAVKRGYPLVAPLITWE